MQTTCEYCGTSFTKKYVLDRFCSSACASSSNYRQRRKPPPREAICELCGEVFTIGKRSHGRFCSVACANRGNSTPIEQRLWSKVDKSAPNGCWEWTGKKHSVSGYGRIMYLGKESLTHRTAWQLVHGSVSDDMMVCHKCDNPRCCNPDHLFLGTQDDNLKDMRAKQRHAYGSQHGQTKFTEGDVFEIRRRYAAGNITQRELANEYRVGQYTIYAIIARKTWKHI